MEGVGIIKNLKAPPRIDLIVEQVEGTPADHENFHYRRFHAIKREYTALLVANPKFAPGYFVAEQPVMRPAKPQGKISDFWCKFMQNQPSAAPEKELLLSGAIGLMHVLEMTSKAWPTTRGLDHPGVKAG